MPPFKKPILLALMVIALPFSCLAGAKSPEDLAKSFMQYFNAQNIDQISGLFLFDQADAPTQESIKRGISSDFSRTITSHELLPLDTQKTSLEYVANGVTYHLDPRVAGGIKFTYNTDSNPNTALTLQYGQKDGLYYFVTAIPKK